MWFGCGHKSNPPFKKSVYAPGDVASGADRDVAAGADRHLDITFIQNAGS